jgi:hypothetical protein
VGVLRHARIAAFTLAAFALPAAAQVDSSFHNLLAGLTQGGEVTLVTPLTDGTTEVTSFYPPGPMSAADAAAAIERARQALASFGIEQPTGAQLAAALVGGTLNVPSGSTRLAGVLPPGPRAGSFAAQIVGAQSLPEVVPQAGTGASAAAGASAPSSATIQLANDQLAQLGIAQPTPEQVRAAIEGGTVITPSGASVTLPGLLPRR